MINSVFKEGCFKHRQGFKRPKNSGDKVVSQWEKVLPCFVAES